METCATYETGIIPSMILKYFSKTLRRFDHCSWTLRRLSVRRTVASASAAFYHWSPFFSHTPSNFNFSIHLQTSTIWASNFSHIFKQNWTELRSFSIKLKFYPFHTSNFSHPASNSIFPSSFSHIYRKSWTSRREKPTGKICKILIPNCVLE